MKSTDDDEKRAYTMRKRAERVRETGDRILDAAFEKFAGAHFVDVTVTSVADAAGCSAQTIYRRYGSKEGLFRALAGRVDETTTGRRDDVPSGDVSGAVSRVIDDYEEAGDTMILMQAQEDRVDVIAEAIARGREQHHSWVDRLFDDSLSALEPSDRQRLHGQLVVALDVQTWKRLRRDLGLSRAQTALAMEEFIHAILGQSEGNTDQEGER